MEQIVVIFDGTFDGFLTVVFDFFKADISMIYDNDMAYQYSFDAVYVDTQTDAKKADRVSLSLQNLSAELFHDIQRAFLCFDINRYIHLFRYIKLAYEKNTNIDQLLGNDIVINIQFMINNLTKEYLGLCGFCRFSETGDNILYCKTTPRNNLVGLLAIHFKDRLNTEKFLIHDIKRNIAAAYDGTHVMVMPVSGSAVFALSNEERSYQELWQSFFNSIGISGRRNKKMQNAHIPKKHQKNALEFSDLSLKISYCGLDENDSFLEVNKALITTSQTKKLI